MILEYWRQGSAPRVEEIQHQLYSRDAGGIFARDMEEYFRSRGYRVFPFRGEWMDLDQHISQGRPLIVCLELNARGAPLHYVVVTGIDPLQNLVLVNDPAGRKLLSMSRADFEQRWRAADNWTLLAVPEIELAGTAFRNEKLPEAKAHLKLHERLSRHGLLPRKQYRIRTQILESRGQTFPREHPRGSTFENESGASRSRVCVLPRKRYGSR